MKPKDAMIVSTSFLYFLMFIVEKSSAVGETDRLGDGRGANPGDGVTLGRASPDDALLPPCLSESVGVVDVGRPVAPVRVKGLPGGGLNGEGHRLLCRW